MMYPKFKYIALLRKAMQLQIHRFPSLRSNKCTHCLSLVHLNHEVHYLSTSQLLNSFPVCYSSIYFGTQIKNLLGSLVRYSSLNIIAVLKLNTNSLKQSNIETDDKKSDGWM